MLETNIDKYFRILYFENVIAKINAHWKGYDKMLRESITEEKRNEWVQQKGKNDWKRKKWSGNIQIIFYFASFAFDDDIFCLFYVCVIHSNLKHFRFDMYDVRIIFLFHIVRSYIQKHMIRVVIFLVYKWMNLILQ